MRARAKVEQSQFQTRDRVEMGGVDDIEDYITEVEPDVAQPGDVFVADAVVIGLHFGPKNTHNITTLLQENLFLFELKWSTFSIHPYSVSLLHMFEYPL